MSKIRVLVVDDSAVSRALLAEMLRTAPDIDVVGVAADAYVARERLVSLKPDVMTLDLTMPGVDGVAFLQKVMEHFPTPTVVVSAHVAPGSPQRDAALAAGAVDVVPKPKLTRGSLDEAATIDLVQKVRAAARGKPSSATQSSLPRRLGTASGHPPQLLVLGASTGGTEALKTVLTGLPAKVPPILVVQHMPAAFTRTFASQLDALCSFPVREAEAGDVLAPGQALVAPGDRHLEVEITGSQLRIRLHDAPLLHGVRPAIDYAMSSVARYYGARALGVILTGMGRDGAAGLAAMRARGAFTIAQDEASSVIFGMPRAAVEAGGAAKVLPLDMIAAEISQLLAQPKAAGNA